MAGLNFGGFGVNSGGGDSRGGEFDITIIAEGAFWSTVYVTTPTANQKEVIYEVPEGKTFYLIKLVVHEPNGAIEALVHRDKGDVDTRVFIIQTNNGTVGSSTLQIPMITPIAFKGGEKVVAEFEIAGNSDTAAFSVLGYLK